MRFVLVLAMLLAPLRASCGMPVSLRFFEDKTASLTAADVAARLEQLPWREVTEPRPSFGFTTSRIWFRFRLPPLSDQDYGGSVFVRIPNANIDRIGLSAVKDGKVLSTLEAGMAVPVSARGPSVLSGGWPTFRINPPLDPGRDYLVSIEGVLPLTFPFELLDAPDFTVRNVNVHLFLGFFFGMLVLAVVFNGFIAASLRSRIYLSYAGFVASLIMMCLADAGLSIPMFWPEWPWWAVRELHVFGGLALFFYAQFVRRFVASRTVAPRLDKALVAMVVVSSLRSLVVLLWLNRAVIAIGVLSVTVSNFLVLAIGAIALRKKIPSAGFFLIASAAFNLGYILFILRTGNVIHVGDFLFFAPQAGVAIEICLLSLALADRIRIGNLELARQKAATVQADKLSALGRMAGEIAHEISNPLAIIHGNAVLVSREAAEPQVREFGATIEKTANRISKLVKGMRALARDTRRDPFESVSFDSILQDALALCAERARNRGVKVIAPSGGEGLMMSCRGAEICQVLVNLISNSLDALDGRSEPWVKVEARITAKRVEIAVSDNGSGIPPEIRPRVQEPFFTTKEAGKGLGLGLSISRTIVENHGGRLWLDEASSVTRFVFSVPAA